MSKSLDHSKCRVSTGICGSLTFGQGELDPNSYWGFPCEHCAKNYKRKKVALGLPNFSQSPWKKQVG